ncbi:MAG: cytochrome c peroxidase [Bacteroidota bacterium]
MKGFVIGGVGLILLLVFTNACKPDPPIDQDLVEMELEVPNGFPRAIVPEDNPVTQAKIDLGKKLFYDRLLSRDRDLNCASCHFPEHAFADPRRLSVGHGGATGTRNAPPLFNLMYHQEFFWDGANPTLETQTLFPIESDFEMNLSIGELVDRLNADPEYPAMFERVFNDSITPRGIVQAIATFERTMISGGSKYDDFVAAGFDSTLFTPQEWRGYQLFFMETADGKHAECFHCHGGFNFDDPEGRYRNNGLYLDYEDEGRYLVTGDDRDRGKFKVPSLRNIEHTAPYMHDGSLATLEEVMEHYATGGQLHQNRDLLMSNIELDSSQQAEIIAFLKTLSDPDFMTNPAFLPE